MYASEAQTIANSVNNNKFKNEYGDIMDMIEESAKNGRYECIISNKLMDRTIKELKTLGYSIRTVGVGDDKTSINWSGLESSNDSSNDTTKKNRRILSIDEIIHQRSFINNLIKEYPKTVFWSENYEFKCSGSKNNDIIIYEAGLKGPADWLYLNTDGRWAHGGYSSRKETYDDTQFIEYIIKINKHNLEYGN